jgi:hypothetical protein
MANTTDYHHRSNLSVQNKLSVNDVIENNMKNYFNKARPKFGIHHYEVMSNDHREPFYKIDKIAVSKNEKADGVFDKYVKLKSHVPAAKYNMTQDWTKNFGKRGAFLKGPKVTYIE